MVGPEYEKHVPGALLSIFFRIKLFISYKMCPLSHDRDTNKLKMLDLKDCWGFFHLHLSNFLKHAQLR